MEIGCKKKDDMCVCVFIVFPFLLKFDNQSFYLFNTVKVVYRGIIDGHYSELPYICIFIYFLYDNKLCCSSKVEYIKKG